MWKALATSEGILSFIEAKTPSNIFGFGSLNFTMITSITNTYLG